MMFIISACGFGWIAMGKVISILDQNPTRNITEISAFYISLTGMVMGLQFFLAGFLAEMTSRNDANRSNYKIAAKINRPH